MREHMKGRGPAMVRPVPVAATLLLALVALVVLLRHSGAGRAPTVDRARAVETGCTQSDAAFTQHRSGVWLTFSGRVQRILADAHGRYLHQRFVAQCADGHTLLVVNDVDLGQRVPVAPGDTVAVRGQYIWNRQGGLVHFTHHDPGGGPGGWILLRGTVYAAVVRNNRYREHSWGPVYYRTG